MDDAPDGNDHLNPPPPEENSTTAVGASSKAVGAGGILIEGQVGGDVLGTGARKITISEEETHRVVGLPNPYFGLRNFTYADREAYAGREHSLQKAVERITSPDSPVSVFFVTGVSGSGKSSFIQAGLLPELISYYSRRQMQVRHAVMHPSTAPQAGLADALLQLGLAPIPTDILPTLTHTHITERILSNTSSQQINLLVIDQFEEAFTQSSPESRKWLIAFLSEFPGFNESHAHILVAQRSDYLNELFLYANLWERATQHSIELRAMSPTELKSAIQQPLFHHARNDERYIYKRFESSLLEKLAADSAQDSAYLPLLQVTLQELWNGGSLTLDRYGSLTDAIRHRAEFVYRYEDYDSSNPGQLRPEVDQSAILSIFLDLINVSLDDEPRRDVRRRRSKSALIGKSVQREKLINSLISARLLSAGVERYADVSTEIIDIIHESLINNWDRLRLAIAERRQILQQRVHFELGLNEWLESQRRPDYLLSGIRLAEALELDRLGDVALQNQDAHEFLRLSQELLATEQQRELQLERRARRNLQGLVVLLTLLLASGLIYLTYPYLLSLATRSPLAFIPAGQVIVGTDDPIQDQTLEGPSRIFQLPEYQIERFEVSNGQYYRCVQSRRCSPPQRSLDYHDPTKSNLPVIGVTVLQANDYCQWVGGSLPTELQWERAARGATGREWPWQEGLLTPEKANLNFGEAPEGVPLAEVESFPDGASPEGVHHLIGNVSEWTSSFLQEYSDYHPENYWNGDPTALNSDQLIVIRGGDRELPIQEIRSTARQFFTIYDAWPYLGFRCVKN